MSGPAYAAQAGHQQQQQQHDAYAIRAVQAQPTAEDRSMSPEEEIYLNAVNGPYAGMASSSDHAYAGTPTFQPSAQQQAYAGQGHAGPAMYPVPASRSSNHVPGKQSVDVPESLHDGASVHSQVALHAPTMQQEGNGSLNSSIGHRARFNSASLPHIVSQKHSKNSNESATAASAAQLHPVDFSEKAGYAKETRNLPDGYQTPPAFSRASSGWNTPKNGPTGGNSPYGSLGAAGARSDASLQFAEGDVGNSRFGRFWLMLMSKNLIVRWLVFICPILLLLWIPGICGVTIHPTPRVWGVPLLNWSIWLTIVWLGWWAGMIVSRFAPHFLQHTLGVVAPEARHYIEYLSSLHKCLTFFLWSLALWISFQPLILVQGPADRGNGSGLTLSQITKALFAIWLCSIILLIEKFIIQIIAYNFHKTSYADRIADNKFAVRALATLYLNSRDIGRRDTLDGRWRDKEKMNATKVLKKGLKSAKKVVQGTSTALGTVASEIIGERVLQSNSPQSMVTSALASPNKSRQLARRIFFSFTPSDRQVMLVEDIAPFFPNQDKLHQVFTIFDRDDNGDVSLEEIEMACLEIHRERLSLSSSMRDLDSAVGRLDQILMSVYYVVAILLFIGLLSASFSGWITSASAFILGLSWLIGSTSQEVLAAIVFLLAKHPYDVGDLVMIDGYPDGHVVKEISLLSTVFKKTDGNTVQIPHTVLNTKAIQNYQRSGPTVEPISWDVDYSTSFEQIEALRDKMLEYLEHEKRDFSVRCDISVASFNDQSKLTLKTCIPYKSNWANDALKSQRRNKWICALKIAMAQLDIYGPAGAGNPSPAPADPTLIKFVNPEAAPPYRSTASSSVGSGTTQAAQVAVGRNPSEAAGTPAMATQRANSNDQSSVQNRAHSSSIAEAVNSLGLSDKNAALRDEPSDVFDYQGTANREDTLAPEEAAHAAHVQLEQRNTALDSTPSAAGRRLNDFRQKDLELGRMQPARP